MHNYHSIAQAISTLLYPYAEVVIHDLKTGLIAAIFNGFSKRKAGDESLIEEIKNKKELPDVFPAYTKMNWDGKKIKSTTATIRDDKGRAIALFCINLDLSKWEEMHQALENWLNNISNMQPDVLFKDDWREKINSYVSEALKKEGASLKTLSKEKKRELVLALHREGAFNAKNAASYVADVLELSRATIYNYLRIV